MRVKSTVKNRIIAIVSVIVLICAVVMYTNIKIKAEVNLVNVIYTAKDIPAGTKITKDMLQVRKVPNQSVPPNAYYQKQDIEGKWTVSGYGIPANSFVYKDKVVSSKQLPDAGNRSLKSNEVTFPLLVDIESSLGNSIMPNSYVDLYFKGTTGGDLTSGAKSNPIYGEVVSHVRVVSVKDADAANVFDAEDYTKQDSVNTNAGDKKYPMTKIYLFAVDKKVNQVLNEAKMLGQVVPVASGQSYTDVTNDRDSEQKNDVVNWIKSQSFDGKKTN